MSKGYGITPENLLRTLPEVLRRDESMLAIASAVADALAARPEEIAGLSIYARIDELPGDLLDILAYDFKVDWWDADNSLEVKRQMLKDSWNVRRVLGTKAAVEKATSAVYKDSKVTEWFEYGGEPYHFKLQVDTALEGVDPVKHQRVLDRVEYYKSLRSTPYSVEYVTTLDILEGEPYLLGVTGFAGFGVSESRLPPYRPADMHGAEVSVIGYRPMSICETTLAELGV